MKRLNIALRIMTLAVFTVAFASIAQAQATRTWVSGVGDDVNPCSRTAPCKTFAGAISKTAKDGEISVLDPGGFGTVTITKSLTINGTHGSGYGSILSALAPAGVTVNITDVNDIRKTVRLVSLDINGASTGTTGVRVLAANNEVHIEDCVIDGLTGDGVSVTAAGNATIHVYDTKIRRVATAVRMANTAGFGIATVRNCKLEDNTNGVEAATLNSFITVSDSTLSDNTTGAKATVNGSQVNVVGSIIAHNGTGVSAAAVGATVRIISNTLLNNTTGILATGTVRTDGQNRSDASSGAPNGGTVTIH